MGLHIIRRIYSMKGIAPYMYIYMIRYAPSWGACQELGTHSCIYMSMKGIAIYIYIYMIRVLRPQGVYIFILSLEELVSRLSESGYD